MTSTTVTLIAIVIILLGIVALMIVGALVLWILVTQPFVWENRPSKVQVDPQRMSDSVETLAHHFYPRHFRERENLEKSVQFIAEHFRQAGAAHVEEQPFTVNGHVYKNVSARFGGHEKSPRIILGAHYDTCGETPGADDNASGIAGIIEIAYLLGSRGADKAIEIVAYCLEEPPFFATTQMGSHYHVQRVHKAGVEVRGVIVLEMIGYFSDAPASQKFPLTPLGWFYPSVGNFIAVVGSLGQGRFTRRIKAGMKGATDLPVYSINAPKIVPGIDFSDHRNYWLMGMKAVMITDTSFYRNAAYHGLEDTAETLDYDRMAKVVVGVYAAMRRM